MENQLKLYCLRRRFEVDNLINNRISESSAKVFQVVDPKSLRDIRSFCYGNLICYSYGGYYYDVEHYVRKELFRRRCIEIYNGCSIVNPSLEKGRDECCCKICNMEFPVHLLVLDKY